MTEYSAIESNISEKNQSETSAHNPGENVGKVNLEAMQDAVDGETFHNISSNKYRKEPFLNAKLYATLDYPLIFLFSFHNRDKDVVLNDVENDPILNWLSDSETKKI